MARKPRPIPDAKKVYQHGLRFLATDGFLRTEASKDERHAYWFQHPSMILSSIASELFLKCLLILEGKAPPDKHNLETLFKLLEPERQVQIESLWNADQAQRKGDIDANETRMGVTIPRDLPRALSDCGDAFVLLRYLYEDPMKAAFYITFFPLILRDVIRGIMGWKE